LSAANRSPARAMHEAATSSGSASGGRKSINRQSYYGPWVWLGVNRLSVSEKARATLRRVRAAMGRLLMCHRLAVNVIRLTEHVDELLSSRRSKQVPEHVARLASRRANSPRAHRRAIEGRFPATRPSCGLPGKLRLRTGALEPIRSRRPREGVYVGKGADQSAACGDRPA
jgi:hypothetical protein